MVQSFNGKNTDRKRRNPYWLSARGINLGSLSQKTRDRLLSEEDDEDIKNK